jgi:hypothetical protein
MNVRLLRLISLVTLAALTSATWTLAKSPGREQFSIVGGVISVSRGRANLRIPALYNVIGIEEAPGRLLVTAYSIVDPASDWPRFLSEVWLFPFSSPQPDSLAFESRRVLVSLESQMGEKRQVALFTVSCSGASAVYIDGWEKGRTLLFDKDGSQLPVEWPDRKPGEECCVDFIWPLAWLLEGPAERLACRMNYHGDIDPLLLIYDLNAGTFEYQSMVEALGEFGSRLMNSILAYRGVYY